MDETFARKLDLLGDGAWIVGAGTLFEDRIREALGEGFPVRRSLPPEGSAGTLLLELKPGDLHRPGYFADLQKRLRPNGKLWIVLPKQAYASEIEFPHTWDEVQRAALKTDLVDNKIAAFSDRLTAVRFVIRLSRRPGAAARSASAAGASPLEISADELELLARRSGELIARWFQELPERPVCPTHDPAGLAALLDEPLPEDGASAESVLDELARLLPYATAIPSPRYHGLLNPAPTPIAVFAESIVGALNQNVGAWRHGTIGVSIEERAIRWLADLYGLPPAAGGTLTSGGTEANLTAVACARHRAAPSMRTDGVSGPALVGYVSREGHFSLDRSFDLLGLGSKNLHVVESDARCRIRLEDLRARIAADRAAGLRPFLLVGILGTTSSGAVDPLAEMAAVARDEGLWFHVDAAYGGGAVLSSELAPLCAGVELADSITVDPHKWFFVPLSAGAILVRDGATLPATFALDPVYIRDLQTEGRKFFREGILGSRRFNGLKLWLSLKRYGRAAYAAEIEREVALARLLHELLAEDGRFTFPHEPVLAIACFRFQPPGTSDEEADEAALRVQREIERAGRHWISTTAVHGRRYLRANFNSYHSREGHVRELASVVLARLPPAGALGAKP